MSLLAIDQGTTSTRAIVFDERGRPQSVAQRELPQIFPQEGWVEHDAEEIWSATQHVCKEAAAGASDIGAIGITNQRETAVVWERSTGRPIHNAIVWQDRRTAELCERLVSDGLLELIASRTGLLIDPYFSATKVTWILDHVSGARERAERGELAFGTIDSFLLYRLTEARVHATDATNASRTMLFDIHAQKWDDELLELLRIPRSMLPEVRDSAADFGSTRLLGDPIAIAGVAGDQQAAAIGQACFREGMSKSTYGTGCFALVNTGATAHRSENRLLATVAYRLGGKPSYALEGSIFSAGATIQWLRDGLGIVAHARDTEAMARAADPNARVHLVPAFTGLGAPHWDAHARGAILGLTRDTGPNEIVRAALEAVGFQTRELIDAMRRDGAPELSSLRVDGGLVRNAFAMQFLADILGVRVEVPVVTETTALGAAVLAGLQTGVFSSPDDITAMWQCETVFEPQWTEDEREARYMLWREAVARVLTR